VSGGEVAGLVVAVFWAVLVTLLAVVLVRLAAALREATALVAAVAERTVPLLDEAAETLRAANEITANVQDAAANANALSSTMAATLGGPLVKLSAFSYGVRSAVAKQRSGGQPERHIPHQTERELIARMVKAEVRAATLRRGVFARLLKKG